MRKFFAILLLAVLALAHVAPASALGDDDTSVPACCRGNGAHRCMRMMRMEMVSDAPRVTGLRAKCPYCPVSAVSATHTETLFAPSGTLVLLPVACHPAGPQQTACRRLSALDRARQKRGPPTIL